MRLYTAQEAADILKLSVWTVWKYGREGKLGVYSFGRTKRYYFKEEEANEVQGNNDDR